MYPSGYSADNTADSGYVDPTAARGPSRPSDLGTQPKGSTLISTTIQARRHLWEYHHPYYGADGYTGACASFAELREDVNDSDEDMNRIYRWDWVDHSQPYADLFLDGEDRSRQTLTVYAVMPRTETVHLLDLPDQPRPGARGPRLAARPTGARRAPHAVGAAPPRHGGDPVTGPEPHVGVIPHRPNRVGDIAACHASPGLGASGRDGAAPARGGR
jgi:hypothetical protein